MGETWKPVPGYGGHYEASSIGRIRSVDRVVVKRHQSGKLIQGQKYAGRLSNRPAQPSALKKWCDMFLTYCAYMVMTHFTIHNDFLILALFASGAFRSAYQAFNMEEL